MKLLEVRAQLAGHDVELAVGWGISQVEADELLLIIAADPRWRNPRIVDRGEMAEPMAPQPRVRTTE
jgi:hypothetical protein